MDASEGAYVCEAHFRAVYSGKLECGVTSRNTGCTIKEDDFPVEEYFHHTDSKNVCLCLDQFGSPNRSFQQYLAVRIGELKERWRVELKIVVLDLVNGKRCG